MKNQLIQVAAAVPSLKVAQVEYNTAQIISMIREHAECGVIVFPELCITGYTCADLFGSDLLLNRAEEALFEIAEATEYLQGLIAGRNVVLFVCTFVGINAVAEMLVSTVVTGALCTALERARLMGGQK